MEHRFFWCLAFQRQGKLKPCYYWAGYNLSTQFDLFINRKSDKMKRSKTIFSYKLVFHSWNYTFKLQKSFITLPVQSSYQIQFLTIILKLERRSLIIVFLTNADFLYWATHKGTEWSLRCGINQQCRIQAEYEY